MAIIDPVSGRLILQIVYDGAPRSGKTESVRALGRTFGRETFTPCEQDGRTVYFDWLETQGGTCLGRPIQFRIIAVPGQDHLESRRRLLLFAADAVVFVADSSPQRFARSLEKLADLRSWVAHTRRRVPVVLQLNKRDLSTGADKQELAERAGDELVRHYVESVATDGAGVREAFVLAASEAVRDLRRSGVLYTSLDAGPSPHQIHPATPNQLLEILSEPKATGPHHDLTH